MVPILTGIFPWSCISQTANPHVTEYDHIRIGKQHRFFENWMIRRGQRNDILNVKNDVKRARIIKMIIENQTSSNEHGYKMVPDPRFDSGEMVPFPTSAASRPILVNDINYRTTFLS